MINVRRGRRTRICVRARVEFVDCAVVYFVFGHVCGHEIDIYSVYTHALQLRAGVYMYIYPSVYSRSKSQRPTKEEKKT